MEVIIKQKQAEIDDYITQENYSSMCEIVVFFVIIAYVDGNIGMQTM